MKNHLKSKLNFMNLKNEVNLYIQLVFISVGSIPGIGQEIIK